MGKRIAAFIALMAMMFGIGVMAASPAQAAPGCQDDWFCLHDTSTSNPHIEIDVYDTVLNQCVSGISPITSYVTNNTNYRWIVSTSNDCSANRGTIYPNSAGAMGPTWNNKIRGVYRTSSTSLMPMADPPPAIRKPVPSDKYGDQYGLAA